MGKRILACSVLGAALSISSLAHSAELFSSGGSVSPVQGAHITWNGTKRGDTTFVNHRGEGVGGYTFYDRNAEKSFFLMRLTTDLQLGVGISNPIAGIEVSGGVNPILRVAGTTKPVVTRQGAYLSWNSRNEGLGETDFINNRGRGEGGFAFFNATREGVIGEPVVVITGQNRMGIGTKSPLATLDVNGGVRAGGTGEVSQCGMGREAGEGTQRYNYSTHQMEYCNGSGWVSLAQAAQVPVIPAGTICGLYNVTSGPYIPCGGTFCPAGWQFRTREVLVPDPFSFGSEIKVKKATDQFCVKL